MSFKNYYDQLNSQTGIKAYIKKRILRNLLKELVKQETEFLKQKQELEQQKETIKAQANRLKKWEQALKKQEKRIDAVICQISDTLLPRETPGLLIDMTQITISRNWGTGLTRQNAKIWITGIQRVVNNLFHQMYNQAENVIPIQYKSDRFITSNAYLSWMEGVEEKADQTVALQQGDTLLLLDDPWDRFAEYAGILEMSATTGIKSYAIVHDLIPVQYPEV